jgi:hypothetical protein
MGRRLTAGLVAFAPEVNHASEQNDSARSRANAAKDLFLSNYYFVGAAAPGAKRTLSCHISCLPVINYTEPILNVVLDGAISIRCRGGHSMSPVGTWREKIQRVPN